MRERATERSRRPAGAPARCSWEPTSLRGGRGSTARLRSYLPTSPPKHLKNGNHTADKETHRQADRRGVPCIEITECLLVDQYRQDLRCAGRSALGKDPDVVESQERP